MTDKRISFDFDLTFINGGGLAGHGFRLDIDSDDIDDSDLAAYIIKDLRLLMVGDVRILNKKIIEERHKRPKKAPIAKNAESGRVLVDLSHKIEDGMETYKGLPLPSIGHHLSFDESHNVYEAGTEFSIGRIDMAGNTGTYIHTPFHRYRNGYDLAGLPLENGSHLPAVVVNATGADRAIDWTAFGATDLRGKAVLVHTGWDQYWLSERYFSGHPYLTEAAATFLVKQDAKLVGIDSLNIDDTSGKSRPVHTILLAAGIPIVEHLTNLTALPEDGFIFSALPPKIAGMGTFPVRAHAIV
jgi:kynurenine formamidase